ncbi:hypothetical protein [Mariniblastus fucicola]|uniref:Uncharacterized protein n=1 Tax=Mariniblastus fucicola TaxID=980251 RepID=A0A5B9PRV4_9BACT|nr:hypothetical protein [Mariniblastus fucicola]QEG24983.1 hypothetical protein MFFC18_49060 [Mariniblastus fucicola]
MAKQPLKDQRNKAGPQILKRSGIQTRRYLEKVLGLSPVVAAQQMVELRWQFCGFNTEAVNESATDDLAERRKWNRKELEKIRSAFWLIDPSQSRRALDELLVDDLPELKIGVERLKLLSHCHSDMNELAKHCKRDINLYNTFRRLVMLSPRKAGSVKEKYLRSLAYAENIEKVHRMVKMMRTEFPELYAIESDWFTQILKIKSRRHDSPSIANGISFDLGIPSWMYVVTAILIVRVLFAFARMAL